MCFFFFPFLSFRCFFLFPFVFPFFLFFLFAYNQHVTRFPFFRRRYPAPFPSIWPNFSPRPVLAPVQKFNAIKSASFCVSVCRVLFILSLKLGPRSDFLPNVVLFGLFLLSAIAYLKIAFYLCTSNPPKGVARSFKDFPPARDTRIGITPVTGSKKGRKQPASGERKRL